jgi:hypothetical protein
MLVILRAVMNLKICMDSYGQPAMMGYRDHNALHLYSRGVRFESPLDLSYPKVSFFFFFFFAPSSKCCDITRTSPRPLRSKYYQSFVCRLSVALPLEAM